MTHIADRPPQTHTQEQLRRHNMPRPVGVRAVRDVVSSLETDVRPLSPSEKLVSMTRRAVNDRLSAVRAAEAEPQNASERIKRAFLLQSRRLRGEKDELTGGEIVDTEDMTTAELASEHLAHVILFSPMAADAHKSKNTWQLSRFNDMLANCAASVSPTVLPNLKSILEGEITGFNRKVAGRSYDIAGQIGGRLKGIDAEIATARALKTDSTIDVIMPETSGDLKGKDITVKRGSTVVHMDIKRKASYEQALLELIKDGTLTTEEAGWGRVDGYAATRQDEDGGWKYLVDADALGKINGLEYDKKGVESSLVLIEKLLSEAEQ